MLRLVAICLTLLFFQTSISQTHEAYREGEAINSVFQSKKSGEYHGTTNGVLFVKNEVGKEIILDFQGSFGKLQIDKDPNEVYDVSTKSYYGKTTSGKTEINYKTYAWANAIGIKLNDQWLST